LQQGEEGVKCDTEPVTSLPKAHVAYEAVKSFFYAHNNDWLHKEKILNLESAMFHLR
jgi:hypothetical protein